MPRPVVFTALPPGPPVLEALSPVPDLLAAGYREQEWRVHGTAVRYDVDPAGADAVRPVADAPFATRVVVRAPVDPSAASGVVVVEWLNVSSGTDVAPDYTYLAEEIVRCGHAWVGVSAQQVGVCGGTPSVGGDPSPGLRGADPDRYGDLDHPGDGYCFDVFTQVAAGLGAPRAPLAHLPIDRLVAVGESQSAFALTTYVNEVAPLARVFDAFLVHSRGRSAIALAGGAGPADLDAVGRGAPVRFRDALDVPVLVVQTETDVLSPRFRYVDARQPDIPFLRVWEVAGTAHADRWHIGDLEPLLGCPDPVNRGQQAYVLRAALRWLVGWSDGGTAPPSAEPLRVVTEGTDRFELDTAGNVCGGVRTPCVDVPVQVLSGIAEPGASVLSGLFGSTRDLEPASLRARHPSADAYLAEYAAATDRAIEAGFVLAEDRAAILAEARPDLVEAAYADGDDAPTVASIHVAKARRLPMRAVERVEVEAGKGIVGDRYHGTKHRHVTVQSREALDEAAAIFGSPVPSELTRRNLTLSHGEVPRDPGARLRVGSAEDGVLLEVVRVAAPCKLLDDTIGPGAQEALRRRGGSAFRVLEGGTIAVGDVVRRVE